MEEKIYKKLCEIVVQNDKIIEILCKSIDMAINGDDILNEDFLKGSDKNDEIY